MAPANVVAALASQATSFHLGVLIASIATLLTQLALLALNWIPVDRVSRPRRVLAIGAHPDDLPELCAAVDRAERLDLAGLMTVAPPQVEPARAFAELARVHAAVLAEHPGATMLSAGMSGDLETAVAAGATHVRVGSAIMGARPPLG